ncbi:MAG: translation initiation factor IF-2 [Candidatus Kerfeldbacteria bacterium RIFOXYA2_FULL_38_24]|uniref:Translation initiation factor IF-2 n=1 Tax=Candidatus Kerfeldbacteria bacterium RIFOXYB2_FULL_38_14 TaxID=1798547 RepID=A0A1G2BFQ9_9BACT|nr:MAG: translation initiation factor IF-2 [Candidatus Kerfeldbacteria bacterium RIFOXYB2_FULL_38_14]OGY88159.1 MAG: translation initiation factor IF-2 [Candidatus Kerfeldbacteria bacterium RIFOXYA2_FULL_38_24]
MNITELYRELKMTKEEFLELVHELGFDIGQRAIKLDDAQAIKIIAAIKEKRKKDHKKSIFTEESQVVPEAKITTGKELQLPEKITVKNFAEKLGKRVSDVIAVLMKNGMMVTINESLEYETAAIIAEDFGYVPKLSLEEVGAEKLKKHSTLVADTIEKEEIKNLESCPPVIVIMGHVDHGKTTLLDTIRKTNVVGGEAGGITQHIGAYQVQKGDKILTFIDTPGHEAFTTMRSRGARVANLAILVVAADDGLKPQTIESINILQEAKLPFIVAINKIDKPGADVERVKKELSELNLIPEDYGGNVICVPLSAKNNKNVDGLLDTLLLVAEMEKEKIQANPKGQTVGSVIESHVDKHTGPIATILIQNGTLKIGDIMQIGNIPGRVRSMKDWNGQNVKVATPAMPVQVLGLKNAPVVGDIMQVVKDKKILKQGVKSYNSFSFLTQIKKEEDKNKTSLCLILRADKLGSLEAIVQALLGIKHKEVDIDIMQKGLGSITENDISLAKSTKALVLGFNVGATIGAEKFAFDENIELKKFKIIYELLDFAKAQLQKLLKKNITYKKIGSLKILAVFKTETKHVVVGGKVEEGVLKKGAPLKILRQNKMVGEGVLSQLQKDKKNISEVAKGSECGLRIDDLNDAQAGDVVEAYEAEETEQTLT